MRLIDDFATGPWKQNKNMHNIDLFNYGTKLLSAFYVTVQTSRFAKIDLW